MYTPHDLLAVGICGSPDSPDPCLDPRDRPYAGWLYFGLSYDALWDVSALNHYLGKMVPAIKEERHLNLHAEFEADAAWWHADPFGIRASGHLLGSVGSMFRACWPRAQQQWNPK